MKLAELRRRKLMTIRGLAAAAGIGATTVYSIEAGKQNPSLTTIGKISAALGVDPLEVDEFRAVIKGESRQ